MITRRLFGSGALTAGLFALGGTASTALAAQKHEHSGLPASIQRLRSRRGEAKPITADERRTRQETARRLMVEQGLGAIILAEGTSQRYFTGLDWWGSERLLVTVLPARGEPFFVCPAFEEGRAREQLAMGPNGAGADVRPWQEDENPYELVAAGLRDHGLSTARLGFEEQVRFVFSDSIARVLPGATFTSATPVTAGCRMIKSEHEVALMRLAAEVTLAAYEATYLAVRPGMTHMEVNELSRIAHERLGFEGAADLVLVGEYSAFPHGSVMPTRVREGTIVLMDGGCRVEGYCSDITRTFAVGKPTDKMRRVFDVVRKAQNAALAAARPGVECGAIDAAARQVVTDAGFGPDYRHFTHRLGHGMGMDGHEWPYLVRGNKTLLAANMTTSNEPGIYIRGEFGIRLEDDMHVTENGAELFTPQSPSLENPFGRA